MYGFLVCNKMEIYDSLVSKFSHYLTWERYSFFYNPLPKFEDDHIFSECEGDLILLDGVITNKGELMKNNPGLSWTEVFHTLYKLYGKDVVDQLRGSFCGIIGDKNQNKLIAFTDQIGSKVVLFSKYSTNLLIASHMSLIREISRLDKNYKLTFCEDSMYEMLITESILGDKTLFNEVKRITSGKRLICDSDGIHIETYHVFRNVPEHDMTIEECIDKADILFRNAVDRIFHKNIEYGYHHECDLSGGLDSRMCTWVAHDLGYKNIINVCYSIENSLDNKISKKISKDLGNKYFFLPMDEHIVSDSIDERAQLNSGLVSYLISTGGYEAIEQITKENNIGICCTGLLGEIQNAYWTEGKRHTPAKYITNPATTFIKIHMDDELSNQYDNFEQMNLYEYSCKTFLLSGLVRQQKAEVLSPFWDTDYLDFIYRVPLKWRKDYGFIQKYMCTKYPKAADYVWQTYRMPVINHYENRIYFPKILGDVRRCLTRVLNKLFRMINISKALTYTDDMNPFQAWYINSGLLRKRINDYFEQTIDCVPEGRLKDDLKRMFNESKIAMDKFLVVNVLSIYKQFGDNI